MLPCVALSFSLSVFLWPFLLAANTLLPSLEAVRAAHRPSHVEALDAQGRVLERLRVDFSREQEPWLAAEEIPAPVREAILRQEDRRFFSHPGVDPLAFASAVRDALVAGKHRGASTLAMQNARLVFPSLRRLPLPVRKVTEGIIAVGLTARWGRSGVLEVWSNLVPMPGSRRGLHSGARTWLGADLSTLTPEEAHRLVAAARSPGREREINSPAASMKRNGRRAALAGGARIPLLLQSLLVKNDSRFPDGAKENALRRGRVRTTIDGDLQARIELLARDERARLSRRNVGGIAVVVVENATGNILASVGNTAQIGDADAWVDNAHARRQAGSSLKPFLYALAFEKGRLRSDTLLSDETYERVKPGGTYRPRNYDGLWHGAVPASVALGSSLNLPALRVLDLVGQNAFAARLEALGFEVDEAPGVLGESVALGTLDVTLEQLASAYTALARGGMRVSLQSLHGDPKHHPRNETRVMDEASAHEVARILASEENRSPGFGTHSPLTTSMGASVKTGTSVDMRDNWCVGFSQRHTVAVWAGNPDGQPMWDVSGVEGAAPLWHDIMELLDGNRRNVRRLAAPRAPQAQPALTPAPALSRARIVSPLQGSVYARDPGIPSSAQRLVLEATGNLAGLVWQIDGKVFAPAAPAITWEPARGTHTLALVDRSDSALATVTFVVK